MKSHFLDNVVGYVRKFGDISVMDASGHEQLDVHLKGAYKGPSKKRATRVQMTVMFTERQQGGEQHTRST